MSMKITPHEMVVSSGEEVAGAATPEDRGAGAASEDGSDLRTLAALQQHHGDQEETDQDVKNDENGAAIIGFLRGLGSSTMRAKASGSRLAPPTRAPSMSGCSSSGRRRFRASPSPHTGCGCALPALPEA